MCSLNLGQLSQLYLIDRSYMDYQLFTVSVAALLGSGSLSAQILQTLANALELSGILDAAVTMDDTSVSFTGQVEAPSAYAAVMQSVTAMVLAGFPLVTAISSERCLEEEIHDASLRIAVA